MKRTIFIAIFLVFFVQICFATPDPAKFAVIRLDYLSYSPKNIYYFQQPFEIDDPKEQEQIYHDLFVQIIPAGDFGSTTIRSANTGKVIQEDLYSEAAEE